MASLIENTPQERTGILTWDAPSYVAHAIQRVCTEEEMSQAAGNQIQLPGEEVSLPISNDDRQSSGVSYTLLFSAALTKP